MNLTPQKSLAVTLQFIGRFTRTGDETLGEASAFVPLQVAGVDDRLRRLLRRETARQSDGKTGLATGSVEMLATIVRESRFRKLQIAVAIVQPGLSKSLVGEDIQALLGATDRFLTETYGMKLRVIDSA